MHSTHTHTYGILIIFEVRHASIHGDRLLVVAIILGAKIKLVRVAHDLELCRHQTDRRCLINMCCTLHTESSDEERVELVARAVLAVQPFSELVLILDTERFGAALGVGAHCAFLQT